jgi:hypothetical protein
MKQHHDISKPASNQNPETDIYQNIDSGYANYFADANILAEGSQKQRCALWKRMK